MSLLRQLLTSPPMNQGTVLDAYRKSHDIEGSTVGAQTSYQVKVVVHYGGEVYGTKDSDTILQGSCVLNDGVTIIAGYLDGKIYKSEDEGITFTQIGTLPDTDGALLISMFCAANGYIYACYFRAGALGYIYRSIDSGVNWTTEATAEANDEFFHTICEDTSGNLYVGGYSGESPPTSGHAKFWKSTDDGDTWVKVHDFGADYRHCHDAEINPHNGWLYVHVGDGGVVEDDSQGIFRSKDGGTTWVRIKGSGASAEMLMSFAFKGDDAYIYGGSDGGKGRIERWLDDGSEIEDCGSFAVHWTVAYRSDLYVMRVATDGRLILGTHGTTGLTSFIAVSTDTEWDDFTILESLTPTGDNTDHYGAAADKVTDNNVLLVSKKEADAYVNARRVLVGLGFDEDVYLDAECRTDFGDIRFRQGVTELDHWIEKKVDSDYAVFWVEVPTIPADPDTTTIHIYYGKADATTASDGATTFPSFFDDGSSTAGWLEGWAGGAISSDGDLLQLLLADAGASWYKAVTYPATYAIMARIKLDTGGTRDSGSIWVLDTDFTDFELQNGLRRDTNDHIIAYRLATVWTPATNNPAPAVAGNVWYILEIRCESNVNTDYVALTDARAAWDSVTKDAHDAVVSSALGISIDRGTVWFDWIMVRKFVDPEPTHEEDWGDKEAVVWPF